MEPAAIDAVGVAKTYDNGAGLRRLDLHVPIGTVVGLIGPSGAGKTTAVRLLIGLLSRQSGDLTVLGADPEAFRPRLRSKIGYLPQDTALYPTLSVRENLKFIAATYGLHGRARARACNSALAFVELEDVQDRRLDKLSGGMRRRAGLAAALVHQPLLMVLDEPTSGQDPILRRHLWERLGELGQEGCTIVVTTQHVAEAMYCDVVALLSDGELIALGAPAELRASAFGGEVVDVDFESPPAWTVLEKIGGAIQAEAIRAVGSHSVRYTVPEAATAIPAIGEAAEEEGLVVNGTDRYLPDFDEVFVRLVDRHRDGIST